MNQINYFYLKDIGRSEDKLWKDQPHSPREKCELRGPKIKENILVLIPTVKNLI